MPRLTAEEVCLAARNLPKGKVPGPGQISAEVYRNLPQLHEGLAWLHTTMLETDTIPKAASQY